MNNGQVAAAVAGGYILGRTRKARLAVTLAALAAGRRVGSPGLGKALDLVKTPEVERLVGTLRGQLVSAGRAAAVNAVGHRVDALSDRLEQGTSTLRGRPSSGAEATEDDDEEPADSKRRSTQRQSKAGTGTASRAKSGSGTSSKAKSGAASKKSTSSSGSTGKGSSRRSSGAGDSRGSARSRG
ncbi:hypothetical protein [Streptomyces sp. NPDC047108]|uniref:hypothetical protein n=1 Tax=Streptomyces sp. NPDC047108 TaxID=3155025 RepID=UPI0033F50632